MFYHDIAQKNLLRTIPHCISSAHFKSKIIAWDQKQRNEKKLDWAKIKSSTDGDVVALSV